MPTEQSPEPSTAQMGSLLDNLGDLSDDQFFRRLSALRAEHKRTLVHYEKLYHEKLMAETGGDIGRIFGEPLFASAARQSADGSERPTQSSLCVQGVAIAARSPEPDEDDDTARPEVPFVAPIPDAPKLETMGRDYNLSVQEPVNTGSDTFNHTLEVVRRSADKPPRSPCPVHKCKEAWTEEDPMSSTRRRSDSSCDEQDYSKYDESRYSRTKDAALDRIEAMWDDFQLSEYTEKRKSACRPKSAEYWRNRITIPEPFHMTIRDESKNRERSRTIAEYEHQKSLKEMEERFECEKKFRATPVPAHVYMPLYDELMEKAETKRRTNVQLAKEVLQAQDKPFQFNERAKKIPDHGRRHSAPMIKHKQFKAKPIPKSVRDDVSERILEEEEYRKIRIRMRSKELLRESSLPPRMASREQYTVGKLKEKLREEKEKCQPKKKRFQPRIKKNMPDFETIHRKQRNESSNRYKSREPTRIATVCEPFSFESSKRSCDVNKIMKDMEKDEQELTENRWPYKNPRAKPKLGEVRRSYDSFPTCTTNANDLRQSKNYNDLRNKTAKELLDEQNREQRTEMAKERRKQIAEKARANDQTQSLKAGNAERLRQYREEEKQRLEDYKRELAAMEARVSKQPFLFERQTQVNARKRAEKQFEDALRKAGVDDESLSSLLQPAKGPRAPEDVPTDEDLPTRDTDLNVTYDKNYSGAEDEVDDDDDKDYHYSHSFVEEDVEDDDDDTRRDSVHEELQDEIAA